MKNQQPKNVLSALGLSSFVFGMLIAAVALGANMLRPTVHVGNTSLDLAQMVVLVLGVVLVLAGGALTFLKGKVVRLMRWDEDVQVAEQA
ncbi:hypothetical protein KSC_077230 [Ktedonobacter sp. SOSP1-52]|uniref:hypothetical protein n=1 Tax=Ktedonobacter sp. SOSP1-52 TaxID=2778366 RepID=UPI0019158860|nr:hypothetical protein [Ktedonobacter sp. SOSP1-52]GHO68831.1 hypothetical protein KSC_077230 [Ktedonobacter sp. SOSP1-52]